MSDGAIIVNCYFIFWNLGEVVLVNSCGPYFLRLAFYELLTLKGLCHNIHFDSALYSFSLINHLL